MGNKTEILNLIGNTPLTEICRMVPDGYARILDNKNKVNKIFLNPGEPHAGN